MTLEQGRSASRWLLAAAYLAAGVLHLLRPAPFLAITPDWVPAPEAVIALTGIAEIAGAVGLCVPPLRRAAGWGLAAYAVCVFPANIHHALDNVAVGGAVLGWGYHAPRLALQPVLVWWALFAAGITSWPWRAR
ncbi:hypothetical protein IP88_06455 [alpha proteobacterium AAP81b]|nr:hypothetical protein IP88_06455 [alpha proteobacterium AAP81b]